MTTTETTTPVTPLDAAREAILEAVQEALNKLDNLPDAEFGLDFDGYGDEEGTIRITHNGEDIDNAVLDTRRALQHAQDVATRTLEDLPASPTPEALRAAFDAGWAAACRSMDHARMSLQHYWTGGNDAPPCRDTARKEAGY